ncbi:hypothetical protein D6851_01130 [Altericroceibacterium spongiae]|uniref:Uncharacterized protein n=2 Tax=Altericroceibacterium spongiae TaxID=2320269 RepID=A0A420ER16_9SPHN|nr:hypothetical protein D6851_01130 [Altericroceibacterium spongiae]
MAQPALAASGKQIANLQQTVFYSSASTPASMRDVGSASEGDRIVFVPSAPNFPMMSAMQDIAGFDLAKTLDHPSSPAFSYSSARFRQEERMMLSMQVLDSLPERIAYAMPDNQQEKLAELPEAAKPEVVVEGKGDERVRWKDIKTYEYAYQTLNLIDAVQTVTLLSQDGHHEANPLLGKDPSTIEVIGYKAAGGLLHYGLTRFLLAKSPQHVKLFQQVSLAIQGGVVAWNMQFAF